VERNTEFDVTITKAGYRTWTGHVTHHMSGGGTAGMAGNVLIGGVIGAIVDTSTGATQDLVPNPLHVTLEAETTPVSAEAAPEAAAPAAPAETTAAPDAGAAPAQPAAATQSPVQ